jgi:hypothetical protein
MRSTKVFISGGISGLRPEEAKRNFERGKRMLLQNTYDYINPLEMVPEGATDKEAMKILLPLLMDCDAILLLSDSKFSKGSHVEETVAQYCGLQIFYEDDLI